MISLPEGDPKSESDFAVFEFEKLRNGLSKSGAWVIRGQEFSFSFL